MTRSEQYRERSRQAAEPRLKALWAIASELARRNEIDERPEPVMTLEPTWDDPGKEYEQCAPPILAIAAVVLLLGAAAACVTWAVLG
jgi:hypothetical protein